MIIDTTQAIQSSSSVNINDIKDPLTNAEGYEYEKMVSKNERSDSHSLYSSEFVDKQLKELMKLDPNNKDKYEAFQGFSHNQRYLAEDMADVGIQRALFRGEGFTDTFLNIGHALNMPKTMALSGGDNPTSLAAFITEKRKEFGLEDIATLRDNSKLQAKADYEKGMDSTKNVDFFSAAGIGQLGAGMVQGIADPMTQLEILATAGIGGGAISGGAKILEAFGIGAGTALVSEIPIQIQAYNWKDSVDIDWSVKDAMLQGGMGVLMGGLILGGGKAFLDVLPNKIKAMKKSKDPIDIEVAHHYETMTEGSAVKNTQEHIEILQALRAAKEAGEELDVVKTFGLHAQKTEVGKIFDEAEISGELSLSQKADLNFEEQLQDPRVLHKTDPQAKATAEYKAEVNYDELDSMDIPNTGKNDLADAKMEEVHTWAKGLEEDVIIPVSKIDKAGQEVIENVSLKETVDTINNDIEGLSKLLECGNA